MLRRKATAGPRHGGQALDCASRDETASGVAQGEICGEGTGLNCEIQQ